MKLVSPSSHSNAMHRTHTHTHSGRNRKYLCIIIHVGSWMPHKKPKRKSKRKSIDQSLRKKRQNYYLLYYLLTFKTLGWFDRLCDRVSHVDKSTDESTEICYLCRRHFEGKAALSPWPSATRRSFPHRNRINQTRIWRLITVTELQIIDKRWTKSYTRHANKWCAKGETDDIQGNLKWQMCAIKK